MKMMTLIITMLLTWYLGRLNLEDCSAGACTMGVRRGLLTSCRHGRTQALTIWF